MLNLDCTTSLMCVCGGGALCVEFRLYYLSLMWGVGRHSMLILGCAASLIWVEGGGGGERYLICADFILHFLFVQMGGWVGSSC